MINKRVVVAPLDWGLGHATRCIPIIQELVKRDCEVWIVSNGKALSLLQKEFPYLKFLELAPYNATYFRSIPFMIGVLLQLPKFLLAIRKEHKQLDEFIDQYKINLVISDNRFGCWTKKVPCIFITHQLNIQMPGWLKWMQFLINFKNREFIKRFTLCWIPDIEGFHNLTGKLSKKNSLLVKHIGILSRFKTSTSIGLSTSTQLNVELYEIAVILSGPEPQRSILEEIIKPKLALSKSTCILVRGLVETEQVRAQQGNIQIVNFLQSDELLTILQSTPIIIARSGYSTVMDLAAIGKKAIFIPTPGQTEQEYLAKRLMDSGICFSMHQKDFDLNFALHQSKRFKGFSNIEGSNELLKKAIDEALSL